MRGVLAIQHVRLHWGKESRGMPGSALRNAVPRTAAFNPPGVSAGGWYQRISHRDDDGFIPTTQWLDLDQSPDLPVHFRFDGDHVWVRVDIPSGVPRRPHLDGYIARLPHGQRVSLHVNTKADGDHARWYFEDAFHIGWSDSATLDLPVFRMIDERALLY